MAALTFDLCTWLPELLRTPGVSGHEAPVRAWLQEHWQPLAHEVWTTPLGSLVARRYGTGPEPRPRLLLAAHMDTIGLMVAHVDDAGWLAVAPIGGLDLRLLPNQAVWVWTEDERPLYGVLRAWPREMVPEVPADKPLPLEALRVETGLPPQQVARRVRPGALISFAPQPECLDQRFIVGPGLDNRASVAALSLTLLALSRREHAWDVDVVATVQEETTMAGAATAGYDLAPQAAVAVDVTFGRGPGVAEHQGFPLDGGVALGMGANIHPKIYAALQETARAFDIPHHTEYLPSYSGTDAAALQVAGRGVPTGLMSIPLRYMHTPVEMVALDDIRRVAHLLAAWIGALPRAFAAELHAWED